MTFQEDREPATTESLCRILQPHPQYFKLFSKIITQYEEKISKLQE